MIQITVLSPVSCQIERQYAKVIGPAISFQKSYWLDTPRGKREKFYDFVPWLFKGKMFYHFPTGYLPKVLAHCRENNIQAKVAGVTKSTPVFSSPKLPGIDFFPNQMDAIEIAITRKRGVIKSPTRTGKTIIAFGIYSSAPSNALFLGDKLDIVQQLADEGREFGFNVHEVHGQRKDLSWDKHRPNVVCMTRRTANNFLKKNEWARNFFDMVVVDEVHHVSTFEGEYSKILEMVEAPLRFGFTATLPTANAEAMAAITGFIGPLIYDLDINTAVEKGLLIKPTIKLLKAPKVKIAVSTKYDDVYQLGIIDNTGRHDLIAKTAVEFIEQGKSVLILVNRMDHGVYQQYAFEKILGKDSVPFLHGQSSASERENFKRDLINKKRLCGIVSVIWKEGINIPTLDVCINAAGGVSELATLQGVGRSLTKVEGKESAIIVDVFDQSHHYLIRHFGERICLYMDSDWL